jgi:hypothetical protein
LEPEKEPEVVEEGEEEEHLLIFLYEFFVLDFYLLEFVFETDFSPVLFSILYFHLSFMIYFQLLSDWLFVLFRIDYFGDFVSFVVDSHFDLEMVSLKMGHNCLCSSFDCTKTIIAFAEIVGEFQFCCYSPSSQVKKGTFAFGAGVVQMIVDLVETYCWGSSVYMEIENLFVARVEMF